MTPVVIIHEAAETEINEAADFYDMENPGLGTAFIDEIERALRKISRNPEAYPQVRSRIRRMLLGKFPYSLFYSIHSNEIRILAVAHQKRRPYYWRGRK